MGACLTFTQDVIVVIKGEKINPEVTWGRNYHHILQPLSTLWRLRMVWASSSNDEQLSRSSGNLKSLLGAILPLTAGLAQSLHVAKRTSPLECLGGETFLLDSMFLNNIQLYLKWEESWPKKTERKGIPAKGTFFSGQQASLWFPSFQECRLSHQLATLPDESKQ